MWQSPSLGAQLCWAGILERGLFLFLEEEYVFSQVWETTLSVVGNTRSRMTIPDQGTLPGTTIRILTYLSF